MSDYAVSCYEEGCKLETELAAVTAQRDRLAEAMREMWPFIEEDDYGTLNAPAFGAAIKKYKQSLDAVKGASDE